MKDQKTINNFVDLKDALAQVRANNPQAETRYEKQAKHMGYTKDTNVKPEVISEVKKKKYDEPLKGFPGNEMTEDEISRAKEVIALQKRHDREKEDEKNAIEKEKESAKRDAERAKNSAESVEEKFKPYTLSGFPRVTDLYVQFKNRADEDENGVSKKALKDFEKAKKIVLDYSKKNKLDIKDRPNNSVFGDPRDGSSAFKISIFAKLTKDKDHDLKPLYDMLSKLPTSEDHGGGWGPAIEKALGEAPNSSSSMMPPKVGKQILSMMKQLVDLPYGSDKFKMVHKAMTALQDKHARKPDGKGNWFEETTLDEGTWAIPDTRDKIIKLNVYMSKPAKFTKPNQIRKWTDGIYDLFGDDGFFDDLGTLETLSDPKEKTDSPDQFARSQTRADTNNLKVGMDLRDILVKALTSWTKGTMKFKNYQVTHAPSDWLLPVQEMKKRKTGKLKFKMSKQVKFEMKEGFASQTKFKLKSKQYPRALPIVTEGYGTRHADVSDILEACNSFGMITEQELQIQQIEKTLGKQGFITYNKAELADIFEERETERMILTLESLTDDVGITEYDRTTIDKALEEELNVEFVKPDGMKAVGPVLKMSGNTYNLKDMHTGKSYTYKYIEEAMKIKDIFKKHKRELTKAYKTGDLSFSSSAGKKAEDDLTQWAMNNNGIKTDNPDEFFDWLSSNLEDIVKGKIREMNEDNNMKTFGQVISEAKFPKKLVRQAGGIAFDKRYVGGNMTGAIAAIEKLKKGLSQDKDVQAMLKLSNESFNNEFYKGMTEEDKTAYQKFFQKTLKQFGVQSPAELEGDKEKEFYNYIDKNWKGDNEKSESVEEGKFSAYSDLLIMKARVIEKEGPKSDKIPAIDSQIKIVMKRLGIKETTSKKVDGRIKPFKEKMAKLGYLKR
tara:strand:+ start:87 stop:2768 length:2682 start_codon:yes stop_codon:yes gene_type:complete